MTISVSRLVIHNLIVSWVSRRVSLSATSSLTRKMEPSDSSPPPPPPKRRRYAEIAGLAPETPLTSGSSDAEFSNVATTVIPVLGSLGGSGGGPVTNDSSLGSDSGFDPVVFAAFVGEELPLKTLKELGDASGGDMERAINM